MSNPLVMMQQLLTAMQAARQPKREKRRHSIPKGYRLATCREMGEPKRGTCGIPPSYRRHDRRIKANVGAYKRRHLVALLELGEKLGVVTREEASR